MGEKEAVALTKLSIYLAWMYYGLDPVDKLLVDRDEELGEVPKVKFAFVRSG